MGTAERRVASDESGATAPSTVRQGVQAPDHDIPARGRAVMGADDLCPETDRRPAPYAGAGRVGEGSAERATAREQAPYRPLWVEEPARRRRMPDPVRTAAVRAVLIIAVTLIQAMVAFLCTLAGSWLAFPMVLSSVASTVVATWGALDVWVTRQVWNQRNGVVSAPSSTARALRRERRRARRQARTAERAQERIRGQGGTGQLSHP
ncbi:hypothetical protein AB0I00_34385 [Streptomyces sp. NPDC050803]|uniref:hypothetical protein n=1 Tax=unclassified Streptomyces TaxID=2593676 RepID=UPI0034343C9E